MLSILSESTQNSYMSNDHFKNMLQDFERNFENKRDSNIENKQANNNKSKNIKGNILDSLSSIENNGVQKDYKKYYKGIYFEEDIFKALIEMTQTKDGKRRNIQSQIVNDCLRGIFNNRNSL